MHVPFLEITVEGVSGTFRNPQPQVLSQKDSRYKWEAHCGTNRRAAVEIGGVLWRFPFFKAQRYKWGAHCGTNWRCTACTFQTSCTRWGFLKSAQCESCTGKVARFLHNRSLHKLIIFHLEFWLFQNNGAEVAVGCFHVG